MDYTFLSADSQSETCGAFSSEEISTFKRYLEENLASSDNSFEYIEENLSYYSNRHTGSQYYSPAEHFHANSNCMITDELRENVQTYKRAIEWFSNTVHPADSEYVIKKEKYLYISDLAQSIKALVEYLNTFLKEDFFIADILIYANEELLQYLPGKNFVFRQKRTKLGTESIKYIGKDEGHSKNINVVKNKLLVVFPVFVPIRKMLFFGEFGYRSGLIEYGRITERLRAYFVKKETPFVDVNQFESKTIDEMLELDGIERSVLNIFVSDQFS